MLGRQREFQIPKCKPFIIWKIPMTFLNKILLDFLDKHMTHKLGTKIEKEKEKEMRVLTHKHSL